MSWGMFGLGLALLTMLLLRRSLRYYRRTRKDQAKALQKKPATPTRSAVPTLIDAPAEVVQWQVEMHELARELKGELDSKLIALQTLIHSAREETERLEDAIERAERAGVLGPEQPQNGSEIAGSCPAPKSSHLG